MMLDLKIKAIQEYLKTEQADWLLLTSLSHEINDSVLSYVLTYQPEHVAMLIPCSGQAILFLTPFEVPEAQVRFSSFLVRALDQQVSKLISFEIKESETVLIRENNFPINLHRALSNLNLKPADNLEKIIALKNSEEIKAMRAVTAKTDELFVSLVTNWSQFKSEAEAARHIYQFALNNNCTVSFPPIIASGPHAAEPHHQTGNYPLVRGFCVIDIGLQINGYCSDLSRTVFIGEPDAEERRLYQLVRESQAAATALIKPGALASEIDIECRRVLDQESKYFVHGLGHGVGTAVHEWPGISSPSQAVLEENMVITIEPGIYYSGKLGIRIEDDILVTKNGPEILNQATKELITVPINTALV